MRAASHAQVLVLRESVVCVGIQAGEGDGAVGERHVHALVAVVAEGSGAGRRFETAAGGACGADFVGGGVECCLSCGEGLGGLMRVGEGLVGRISQGTEVVAGCLLLRLLLLLLLLVLGGNMLGVREVHCQRVVRPSVEDCGCGRAVEWVVAVRCRGT